MPSIKTSVKIKENLKGLEVIGRKLKRQKDMVAKVGHLDSKQHFLGPESIAQISYINQQGTRSIPSRPYMAVALKSPVFIKAWNKAVNKIALGETTVTKKGKVRGVTISSELPKLAKLLRDIMMGVIQTDPWSKRNSASTIAKKGFDHPLLETGTLVNDIEFELIRQVSNKKQKGLNTVAK